MTAVDFAAFVDRLATVSGEAVLPFFRTSLGVENKGGPGTFDPVTAADRAAETAMRTLIRESSPDHGIVGEESATSAPMLNIAGCSIQSMAPNPSSRGCRRGAP